SGSIEFDKNRIGGALNHKLKNLPSGIPVQGAL
ncbi:hypothetical protein OnM2_000039, partial [Erysiphe neolycopersici]